MPQSSCVGTTLDVFTLTDEALGDKEVMRADLGCSKKSPPAKRRAGDVLVPATEMMNCILSTA